MTIDGALQTPGGDRRVEIVRRGRSRWYRVVNGNNVVDWLSITAVERILAEAGVDMAELVDANASPEPGNRRMNHPRHGAA